MFIIYDDDAYKIIEKYKADIRQAVKDNNETPDAETIQAEAQAWINADYQNLCDDVTRFDETTQAQKIYVVASLGLWYGRRRASATFTSLYAALHRCFEDYNTLYFKDKRSRLVLKAYHHDGVNIFKFYKIINGKKYAIKYGDIIRA